VKAVGLMGRHPDPLQELAASLAGPAFAIAADVGYPEMVRRAVDAVTAELGAIDRFSAYSVSMAAQLRWVDNLAEALGAGGSPCRR
jgi:hypothetical protein